MSIIKQIMLDIQEAQADEAELFPEAEKQARKLGLVEEGVNPDEANRIASFWRGKAAKMTDAQLREKIGHDLEQLEYSPEDVAKGVASILKKVRK